MRIKHTFRLPPALSAQLADYAGRKRMSQASIVEAALASFLSPDGSERLEAAISRRLDRHTRQLERLAHHVKISNEAIALFVRFWLTTTPPLPDATRAAAQASGTERYHGFIEALAFAIRKPAVAVFTLEDYVTAGIMTADQAGMLRFAVSDRRNILVAGGTSTGKTTLTNALLAEVAKTTDRVVLIEDTRELQCAAPNLVALRTKEGVASLSDLVRSSLRLRPDRTKHEDPA